MGELSDPSRMVWAPRAWLSAPGSHRGAWHQHVALRIGADGRWSEVTPGIAEPPRGATVLPGLVDTHSHAFQRAFAGLAERRESDADDFWSWRDRMYRVALRMTPEQLRAVAAQLYVELLAGGYTQVCEFHYLQHREDGAPYDDPLALAWAVADAAADAGIGATLLPALYERAGFSQPTLRDVQRRFRANARYVWSAARRIAEAGRPLLGHRSDRDDPAAPCRDHHEARAPAHLRAADQTAGLRHQPQLARAGSPRSRASLDALGDRAVASDLIPSGAAAPCFSRPGFPSNVVFRETGAGWANGRLGVFKMPRQESVWGPVDRTVRAEQGGR
jgi:hypothetical protein